MGNKKKNNGSCLEGLRAEIGGLIQQDTNGDIEYIRNRITNEPDGGIDSLSYIKNGVDYFEYFHKLKDDIKE